MILSCGAKSLSLDKPVVMGILNTTPDSFSDGGNLYQKETLDLSQALIRAECMVKEGAQIIDVGGESTRPGAKPVSLQQELDRVVPVVEAITAELDVVVSVDTSSPQVIKESASVGAGIINDVRALQRPEALTEAAKTGLPICMMHMQGNPETMQDRPDYLSVLDDVEQFLSTRIQSAIDAGIAKENIIVDPGFGFGKTLQHNLELLARLDRLSGLGCPILVGLSRKSLLAAITDRAVNERLAGSLALAMLSAQRGASIIRVHDVAATVDVLKVLNADSSALAEIQ